ncbi:MAG: GatB/YqeY domain-containing protein, partial [Longimicrobiales bacterium]
MRADLNTARRERDKLRTLVLSTTLSEVKNRQIELGREPTDEDVTEVVGRAI